MYSPEKQKMFCPYCESVESEELQRSPDGNIRICPDCGGEIPLKEHTAATQCPYCSNYLILDERVEGEYLPGKMIPFKLGKETCKKVLRDKFEKSLFAPTDFLSEVRLNSMQGTYVPFWLYDYDVNAIYEAEGTKVRSWVSGNMSYTETSYYEVRRNIDIGFHDIPVDASVEMPDDVMDLMEPYDYMQMIDFEPRYMSGFYAEKYNMDSEQLKSRANQKMMEDTRALVQAQVSGYSSVRQLRNDIRVKGAGQTYGLLPVWKYLYRYNNQEYPFYVNGQTGKIVGTVPISAGKVWIYTGTLWACLTTILAGLTLCAQLFL